MSPAVLLDPYSPLDVSALEESKLEDCDVPLIRQDTPQLTLHDYRRWQYSPILSPSPELDYRRVRRKPSIQNLTGRTAHSAFSWTPSSIPPPLSIHNCGPHDPQLQPPSTPRPRAYTASPSLSSTITTLQSTPTHTPIVRGGSFDEQRRIIKRFELEEPIHTKRKFSAVKHARRFPQRQPPSETSQDSGLYKVYAAVFDISGEQGSLSKEPSKAVEPHPSHAAAPTSKRDRAVRFTGVDTQRGHSISTASSSGQSFHRRDQTATSSFSLSKFEFPAPPNEDNWAGALEHLPKSPSATVLYRGASFDLINPHASLLLGNHSIETPAEIDGLLDDYFQDHNSFNDLDVMSSNTDMTTSNPDATASNTDEIPSSVEPSQQSLRPTSDNVKQTHTLYDDADTARRNILRIPTPLAYPPKVVTKEPPPTAVTMPSFVREPDSDVRPGFGPLKRSNTNPFRSKIAAIGRSLGVNAGDGNRDLAEEGRSPIFFGTTSTAGIREVQRRSTGRNADGLVGGEDERFSDPFDLSVSEDLNNAELLSLNGVLREERSAMLASVPDPSGRRTALSVEDDSKTHALSETERDLGLIYNGYDYTRETMLSTGGGPSTMSDASIERSRHAGDYTEQVKYGWATPLSPGAQFRSSHHGFCIIDEPEPMRPQPLAIRDSRRNGFTLHRNMPSVHREMRLSDSSDVATSEQTYGETNQLLLITPSTNAADSHCGQATRTTQPHASKAGLSPGMIFNQFDDDDNKENTPPGLDDEGFERISLDDPHESAPRMRTGSVMFSPSFVFADRLSRPQVAQFRVSSMYQTSEWETERSESPGLTETDDEDEFRDRYSHSNIFAQSTRVQYGLLRLASTKFPDLNNPNQELSPQGECGKGKGGVYEYMTAALPRTSAHNSSDDEINVDVGRGPYQYVPPEHGVRYVPAPLPDIDFNNKPIGDAKRALNIIENKANRDKVGCHRICSPGSRSSLNHAELRELEEIRSRNPDAVHEATARMQASSSPNLGQPPLPNIDENSSPTPSKFQRMRNPFIRHDYQPQKSFQKVAAIGRHEIAHGSSSSQRGLLSPRTPASNGLEFSESEGTFVTVRDRQASTFTRERGWDPHDSSPTARALARLRSPPSQRYTAKVPSKLRAMSSRSGKAAVEGQIELKTFRMRAEARRKGLTDAELMQREPTWTRFPVANNVHRKHAKLLPHKMYIEQKRISLKYQTLSAIVPFCALVYGLGGCDWLIRRQTKGRITSMGTKQKRYALVVYFPLQLLGYLIIALVVGIVVVVNSE